MIGRISNFIGGERRYLIRHPAALAATLLLHSSIPCFNGRVCPQGYEISVERREGKALEELLNARGIPFELQMERGLVPFLLGACRRPGLLLGVVMALFFIYECSQYVWDIRVSGNEQLSSEQVIEILKEEGFAVGSRYANIDLHRFCNIVPLNRQEIAWLSVNMMGTVAEVQIIETVNKPPKEEPKEGLFNLVADREGQIVRYELSTGRALVNVGSTVKKGQMLVAGFSEKEGGLHPRVSAGRVFAKVWLFEEAFIPFKQSKTVEEKAVMLKKSVNFLGKEIIFLKNSRFLEEKYVTIDDEYFQTVLGVDLPLPITVTYALPLREVTYTVDARTAEALAKEQLSKRIQSVSEELLFREYEVIEKEDGVLVICKALCITDIAKAVEVTMDEK